MTRQHLESAASTALGYGLASGAWAVNLAIYPWCLAYAVALIPAARAFDRSLDLFAEELEARPLTTNREDAA